MSIVFQEEGWEVFYKDCQDLWKLHYQEIASDKERKKLSADTTRFQSLEACGQLYILTARKNGVMVGYVVAAICYHPHFSEILCAFEDMYFLAPGSRGARVGMRMVKRALAGMQARGAQMAFFHTKDYKNNGRLLTACGLGLSDHIHSGWL